MFYYFTMTQKLSSLSNHIFVDGERGGGMVNWISLAVDLPAPLWEHYIVCEPSMSETPQWTIWWLLQEFFKTVCYFQIRIFAIFSERSGKRAQWPDVQLQSGAWSLLKAVRRWSTNLPRFISRSILFEKPVKSAHT